MRQFPLRSTLPGIGRRRRSVAAFAVVATLGVAALLAFAAVAPAADMQVTAHNQPGHDVAVMLADLGKGKAGLYLFVSDGHTSDRLLMWTGKLPAKRAKLVAGDFNADGFTDAMVLLDQGKKGTKLVTFTSDGAAFTPGSTWTGKRGQIVWKSASLTAGRFGPEGKVCALVSTPQKDGSTLLLAFDYAEDALTARCLVQEPKGALTAGTQVACADIDKNLSDEAIAFSPAPGGGTLHVFAYDGTALAETTSTALTAPVTAPRLASGDVNGDGADELLLVGSQGTSASVTAYGIADGAFGPTPMAVSPALAAKAQVGAADMDGDGKADLVAYAARGKKSGTEVIGASDGSAFVAGQAWAGAMRTANARFACARTQATIVKDNVHVLPDGLGATIVSLSADQSQVVFIGAPDAITALAPGDVFILEPCEQAPNGLVRTVVTVDAVPGGTGVTSTQASLQDVFAQAQLRIFPSSPASDAAAAAGARAGKYDRMPFLKDCKISIETTGDAGPDVPAMKYEVNGSFNITAGLAYWADVTWTHLWAGAYFYVDEEYIPKASKHTVQATFKKQWGQEKNLPALSASPTFSVGPVPMWVDLKIWPRVKISAETSCTAWADLTQQFSFRVGAELGSSWTSLCDSPDPDFVPDGGGKPKNLFQLSGHDFIGTVSARASVNLVASAMVWSIIGPEMEAGPYVRLTADTSKNPPAAVYAGVGASMKFKLRYIDDWKLGPWTLWETKLGEWGYDPSKPRTDYSAPNTYINAPTDGWVKPNTSTGKYQVTFTRHYENTDAEHPYRDMRTAYKIDGGRWTLCLEGVRGMAFLNAVIPAGTHTLSYYSFIRTLDGRIVREDVHQQTIRVDGVAPKLQVPSADWNQWHTSRTVPVSATDNAGGSGVAAINQQLQIEKVQRILFWDWVSWSTVTDAPAVSGGVVTFPRDGVYWATCSAVDGARNQSAVQSWLEKIDATAPTTTAGGADDSWHANPVTVNFHAGDPGAQYSGSRTWETWELRRVWWFYMPVSVPHTITFTLGSGVAYTEYRVNGGAWTRGASLTVSAAGDNTVDYRSADYAGNLETYKTCHVKIGSGDGTAPTTTVSGADDAWHNAAVTLTFSATDNAGGSGVAYTEYRVDGGSWVRGTSVSVPDEGDNTVDYRSADVAGNLETYKTCHVKIDTTAPTVSRAADRPADYAGNQWTQTVTFTFAGADPGGSGVNRIMVMDEFNPEGGWQPWRPWTATTTMSFDVHNDDQWYNRLSYYAVDNAGNQGPVQQYEFFLNW